MKIIRNKGCFCSLSWTFVAFEFLLLCLQVLIPVVASSLEEKKKGFNIVIVIVFSVFELKKRSGLTCKYFRLNWAKLLLGNVPGIHYILLLLFSKG